jgi:hypothetical protein
MAFPTVPTVEAMAFPTVAAVAAVASPAVPTVEAMATAPMPTATPRVPWNGTGEEYYGQYDDNAYPLL